MNTVKTIAKNTGVLIVGSIISNILLAVLVIYIARHLGDVEFGKYSFAFAFTGLFFIVVGFGLAPLITYGPIAIPGNSPRSSVYLLTMYCPIRKRQIGHDRRYFLDYTKIKSLSWKPKYENKEAFSMISFTSNPEPVTSSLFLPYPVTSLTSPCPPLAWA